MQITGGGLLILLIIALVIVGIIVIKRLISGEGLPFAGLSFKKLKDTNIKTALKKHKPDENLILCLNEYPEKLVGEYMLKTSVCKDADTWDWGSKKYLFQIYDGKTYKRFDLPDTIAYPPERLARMMGCEPLRRLKSLKFTWLERAAPFAPVVAILIGAFLFIIVL